MLGTKLKRLVAGLLCFAMLFGGTTVIASASGVGSDNDGAGSVTDATLSDLKELLNAISYDEYVKKNQNVPKAESGISVDVSKYVVESGDGFEMKDVEGEQALFTPQDGAVSWTINVDKTAKYAIKIVYYPDHNRSTSIERILKINDVVPFAEARFLTMPKNWIKHPQTVFDYSLLLWTILYKDSSLKLCPSGFMSLDFLID